MACGLNFEDRYGRIGAGFIEVHHLQPVSELKEGEKTRIKDLALVCSNCHKMLHRRRPWLGLDDLIKIIKK